MKKDQDIIDEIFKKGLGEFTLKPSDDLFEEAFKKSIDENEKPLTMTNFKHLGWWWLLPLILLVLSPVALYYFQDSNEVGIINMGDSQRLIANKEVSVLSSNNKGNDISPNTNKSLLKNEEKAFSAATLEVNENSKEKMVVEKSAADQIAEKSSANQSIVVASSQNGQSNNTSINSVNPNIPAVVNSQESKVQTSEESETPSIPMVKSDTTVQNLTNVNPPVSNPFVIKKSYWSVEVTSGLNVLNTNVKSASVDRTDFAESRNNSFMPSYLNYNFGVMAGVEKGRFSFQTGVQFSKLSENSNYGNVLANPKLVNSIIPNGNPYDFISNGNYFNIDTTMFWQVDSNTTDSLFIVRLDTLLVNIYDTISSNRYDTLVLNKLKVQYSLFEFPIWFGYDFSKPGKRWGYSVKIGIIPAMLLRQQGSYYYNFSETQLTTDPFPMRKFIMFGAVKTSLLYQYSPKMVFSLSPEAKATFFSVTDPKKGWSQYWKSWGINVGVKIYF